MCFSATVSFTVGTVLLAMGCVAARRCRSRAELAYALIPMLFGIQQWLEGFLWLTFDYPAPQCKATLTQLYSGFSQVIWPVYIPLSVLVMETVVWRKKMLSSITLAGASVSAFLLFYLTNRAVLSQVTGQHISYIFPHFHEVAATGLYLLGACVSPLVSSHRSVRWFGVAVTLSLIATYAYYSYWLISVWCFFAAITSCIVLWHFPKDRKVA